MFRGAAEFGSMILGNELDRVPGYGDKPVRLASSQVTSVIDDGPEAIAMQIILQV